MKILFAVAIGGAIGALARFQLSQLFMRFISGDFIYNILVINILGCFLMGISCEFLNNRLNIDGEWHAFFIVGVLGAFTTFSAFALDILILAERGNFLSAGVYILSSVIFSILGLLLGIYIMRITLS